MQKLRNKYLPVFTIISIFIFFSFGCSNTPQELPIPAATAAPVQELTYPKKSPVQPTRPAPAAPAAPAASTKIALPETDNIKQVTQTKITPNPKNIPSNKKNIRPSSFPLSIVDREGNEVVFEGAPDRIVAFDAAAVETIFAIGQGHRVIATHDYVSYPPEVDSVAKVGDAFTMDIEAIVNLAPDLVYIFYPTF